MSTLSIFPNLSIYKLKTHAERDTIIHLPDNISDVTVFAKSDALVLNLGDTIIPASIHDFQLIRDHIDTIGTRVLVDGQYGTLSGIGEDYVDINLTIRDVESFNIVSALTLDRGLPYAAEDTIVKRIYKPHSITRYYNTTQKNAGGTIIKWKGEDSEITVTGIIPNLVWQPVYTIVLSNDPNRIENLTLSGDIRVPEHDFKPFSVNQIEFNTKPLLYSFSNHSPSTTAYSARSVGFSETNVGNMNTGGGDDESENHLPTQINQVYVWGGPNSTQSIEGQLSTPLVSTLNINIERVYFLQLVVNPYTRHNQAIYGYMYEDINVMPDGILQTYDSELNFVGRSRFSKSGRHVVLKLGPENHLQCEILVHTVDRKISLVPDAREPDSSSGTNAFSPITTTITNNSVKNNLTSREDIDMRLNQVTLDVRNIQYTTHIHSDFEYPVSMFLEYPARQKIYNARPWMEIRTAQYVYWHHIIKPGDNTFEGSFDIAI